jgi:hypothetical protein
MSVAVTESGRSLQAAVTLSGGRCCINITQQEAGVGRDGGRYINNALRSKAGCLNTNAV